MENNELLNMLSQLFDEKLEPIKQNIKRIDGKIDKNIMMLEDLNKKIEIIAEVQTAHKEQTERDFKTILEEQNNNISLIGDSLKNVSADVKEVKTEVIEIKENVEGIRKDLNTVEIITSKYWNEIAHFKAVK